MPVSCTRISCLEFMIQLNRATIHNRIDYVNTSASNPKILALLDFLNTHLTEDISIDRLSEQVLHQQILSDAQFQRGDRLHDRKLPDHQAPAPGKGSDPRRLTDHRSLLCQWL
ncbi:MAG: hypothetical protein V8S31_07470 [Lachnospiraceae bacterium]